MHELMAQCACRTTGVMTAGCVNLLHQHRNLLAKTKGRRNEDRHCKHATMPSGPDLGDHYGHRSHDIDIERI
ncbi:MAG TPA: hypothetical protein ENI72_03835 [Rhodospirillales bacterium]|nr:hypothetical protein [Rhodospirillales bacterium]